MGFSRSISRTLLLISFLVFASLQDLRSQSFPDSLRWQISCWEEGSRDIWDIRLKHSYGHWYWLTCLKPKGRTIHRRLHYNRIRKCETWLLSFPAAGQEHLPESGIEITEFKKDEIIQRKLEAGDRRYLRILHHLKIW